MATDKAPGAFLTIGELSDRLRVPQHVLRYWETRFPQLRPIQRAGNRRYYRPDDVALAARIQRLLGDEGYTVKGVQQLLARKEATAVTHEPAERSGSDVSPAALRAIRDALQRALDAD